MAKHGTYITDYFRSTVLWGSDAQPHFFSAVIERMGYLQAEVIPEAETLSGNKEPLQRWVQRRWTNPATLRKPTSQTLSSKKSLKKTTVSIPGKDQGAKYTVFKDGYAYSGLACRPTLWGSRILGYRKWSHRANGLRQQIQLCILSPLGDWKGSEATPSSSMPSCSPEN